MWECGLKPAGIAAPVMRTVVTPYVGVWIETRRRCRSASPHGVTPYVGVWIETILLMRT